MNHGIAWLAPVALLLAACAGPMPPNSGPATLSTGAAAIVRGGPAQETYLFGRGHVTITRIDDTTLVDGRNNSLYGTIEVSPGRHAIYFSYSHSALCVSGTACAMSLRRERKLALDAVAGHVYRVGASYRAGRLWTWITDQSQGLLVAGEMPGGADWAAGAQGLGGGHLF